MLLLVEEKNTDTERVLWAALRRNRPGIARAVKDGTEALGFPFFCQRINVTASSDEV